MKKTVEAEKLKTEVKDLREIVDLDGKSTNTDGKARDEEFLLKMKRNGSRRNNPQTQSSPKSPRNFMSKNKPMLKKRKNKWILNSTAKTVIFKALRKEN